MWDDEDNNPYGSFARHDSNSSDVPGLASPAARKRPKRYLIYRQDNRLTYSKFRTGPQHRLPRHRPPPKNRPSLFRNVT